MDEFVALHRCFFSHHKEPILKWIDRLRLRNTRREAKKMKTNQQQKVKPNTKSEIDNPLCVFVWLLLYDSCLRKLKFKSNKIYINWNSFICHEQILISYSITRISNGFSTNFGRQITSNILISSEIVLSQVLDEIHCAHSVEFESFRASLCLGVIATNFVIHEKIIWSHFVPIFCLCSSLAAVFRYFFTIIMITIRFV